MTPLAVCPFERCAGSETRSSHPAPLGVPHPQVADPFSPHRHGLACVQRQVVAVAVGEHGVKEHPAALGGAHPQAPPAVGLGKRGGAPLLGGGNVQEQG